jgi:hypothetical protein
VLSHHPSGRGSVPRFGLRRKGRKISIRMTRHYNVIPRTRVYPYSQIHAVTWNGKRCVI